MASAGGGGYYVEQNGGGGQHHGLLDIIERRKVVVLWEGTDSYVELGVLDPHHGGRRRPSRRGEYKQPHRPAPGNTGWGWLQMHRQARMHGGLGGGDEQGPL